MPGRGGTIACVLFTFEDLELDTATFELRSAGVRVPLEPQAFDVLVYLVRHRDRVVSKEELMDEVWGGRFVTETAVTSRIKQIRRAVGDDGGSQRVVRTLHGRGYRFVSAGVERTDATALERDAQTAAATAAPSTQSTAVQAPTSAPAPAPPAPTSTTSASPYIAQSPPVHYTESDGLNIAYQVTGGGELDIVLVAGFISHLDHDWGDPRHAHFLDRLGTMGRLIRFDKRGTGMSDRPPGLPDLETRMHDVLAVMDAAGSRRAVLVGYSEGGPMACLFSATHPERTAGLVLYGSYPKRIRSEDYPWAPPAEERQEYTNHLVTTWDWESDMRMRCPSADDAMARWWAQRSRAATTPSTLRALMDMNAMVDVRDVLPAIRVPTLVLHRRDDEIVRLEDGRYLAARIPTAQLVELPGRDHFVSGDPDQILDAIAAFLARRPEPAPPTSALAALVATSGPGSESLLEELEGSGARLRGAPGGRRIALFDGPATAIRVGQRALAAHPAVAYSVHVAEVERDAPELRGFGVSTVIALAGIAPPGAVWASATVRDLLAGSGVALEAAGAYDVGPAGNQLVFAAVDAG